MRNESFEGALQFYLRTKKMESAEDLNLFKDDLAGVYASVEDYADTSIHETENHLGKNTLVGKTDNKNTLNKVETVPFSPLKSGSSSLQDRLWSHASSGIGSGSLSPSDPLNISSTSALPSKNTRCIVNCINVCNVDRDIITLHSKNSCSLVNGSVSGSNGPFFLRDNVCSSVTDFPFSENECHGRKDDLMDYDWADIGNLDDIDVILRFLTEPLFLDICNPWKSDASHSVFALFLVGEIVALVANGTGGLQMSYLGFQLHQRTFMIQESL